ncbi:Blue-light photoreceptor [Symbiodinium microadriaticum]|uniref:Blue-light photoreceptor n=1 Tax=Symbiodinium microadriaticum TaxID=2951 RepID=A0A1Q9CDC5_SYMMI|nr:Blue-light photoreceptor [Symbiodinium microadriaticum]
MTSVILSPFVQFGLSLLGLGRSLGVSCCRDHPLLASPARGLMTIKTSTMPPVPRQQRRRKAAVVAAVLLLATITGLNLRAVAQEPSAADVDVISKDHMLSLVRGIVGRAFKPSDKAPMADALELDGFHKQVSVYSNISRKSDPDTLVDPEVFSRQCTEIDEIATKLVDQAFVEEAMKDAIKDCRFCVTIAAPQAEDCPLIAISDEFVSMTGYRREEVLGKNCRFLNRNCYLEPSTFADLRHTCTTGAPFSGTILNRKKSGTPLGSLV